VRQLIVLVLLALLPAAASAQQTQQRPPQRAPTAAERAAYEARRDSLETEIVNKFIDQLTRELKLDAEQRTQTQRVLRESGLRRRELANATRELRGRMSRAGREPATTEADFNRLLMEFENLRGREHSLWQREQEELARIYSPRQRVQFVDRWTRFQESLREILSDRMRSSGRHEKDG
jgi:Spy/CpxP family protein refolding chaperone